MRCNLVIGTNEVIVRDYTLIEDNGIAAHVSVDFLPGISCEYEDDEESPGKQMIVVKGESVGALLKWLDFLELPVRIMT